MSSALKKAKKIMKKKVAPQRDHDVVLAATIRGGGGAHKDKRTKRSKDKRQKDRDYQCED
jgi:hypothetical protein